MNYGKKLQKIVVTDVYGLAEVVPTVLMSGQVCRVDYQKNDGTVTTMLCRYGVKKYLAGTGESQTNLKEGRVSVYSFDRGGYRTLKLNGILTIKHGGVLYDFRNYHALLAMREGQIGEALMLSMPAGEYEVPKDQVPGRTQPAQPGFPLYG